MPMPCFKSEGHSCPGDAVQILSQQRLQPVSLHGELHLASERVSSDFANKMDFSSEGCRGASAVGSAAADGFGDRRNRGFTILQ